MNRNRCYLVVSRMMMSQESIASNADDTCIHKLEKDSENARSVVHNYLWSSKCLNDDHAEVETLGLNSGEPRQREAF